jgi:hypothetical protein
LGSEKVDAGVILVILVTFKSRGMEWAGNIRRVGEMNRARTHLEDLIVDGRIILKFI